MSLQGDIPGELNIKVEIEYLAEKLNGQNDNIYIQLKNCTLFEYERHWSKNEIQIYKTIKELEGISPALMALSCDEEDDYLLIWDISGLIKTRYESAELHLENGDSLSFAELNNASKEYWDNFGSESSG